MEYLVNTKHYNVNITVKQGIIMETNNICKWAKGHTARWFKKHLTEKGILTDWTKVSGNKNKNDRENI